MYNFELWLVKLKVSNWNINTNLAQGALQLPQEVVVTQINSFVVDVINPELQLLHYFKVVVDDKFFCKPRAQAILDFLRAAHLLQKIGQLYALQHATTVLHVKILKNEPQAELANMHWETRNEH